METRIFWIYFRSSSIAGHRKSGDSQQAEKKSCLKPDKYRPHDFSQSQGTNIHGFWKILVDQFCDQLFIPNISIYHLSNSFIWYHLFHRKINNGHFLSPSTLIALVRRKPLTVASRVARLSFSITIFEILSLFKFPCDYFFDPRITIKYCDNLSLFRNFLKFNFLAKYHKKKLW